MKSVIKFILVALVIVLYVGGFGWGIIRKMERDKLCDTYVIMNDDNEYSCTETTSYENGITLLEMCDGSKLKVPTISIKTIKIIEIKEENE